MLRCPKCGRYGDKSDGDTICLFCGCKLITQDEYSSSGYHADQPTVECPYCHSTDTKKISSLSKAGNVSLFGVFAIGKASKQWHCNKCNSDF